MKSNLLRLAKRLNRRRQKHRLWRGIIGTLGCAVAFCTVCALILPAITAEQALELHCSEESLSGHSHTPACYDDAGLPVCGLADFVIHSHDKSCFSENGRLICALKEMEAHEHSDACYEETHELICDFAVAHDPAATSSTGSADEAGVLSEQNRASGHVHGDACYVLQTVLICDEAESEGHGHGPDCYGEDGLLICEQTESSGHAHTDECYKQCEELVCHQDEGGDYAHSPDCSGSSPASPQPEQATHNHTEECYSSEKRLICDQPEAIAHIHTDDCYGETGDLNCGLLEVRSHQHSADCAQAPILETTTAADEREAPTEEGPAEAEAEEEEEEETEIEELRRMRVTGPDYSVTVAFPEEANLPDTVTLSVRELLPGTSEYDTCFTQTLETLQDGHGLFFCRFFDVSFLADGLEIEPEAPVDVQIAYAEGLPVQEGALCNAVHFTEHGTEVLDAQIEHTATGEDAFIFTQDSFSVVGTTISSLTLDDGSYIFYRDGYAIGVDDYGPCPIQVTVDENGYVRPAVSSEDIRRITWSYLNDGLQNQLTGEYLAFNGGVGVSSSAVTTAVRIVNNAVRFSQYYYDYYNYSYYNCYLGYNGTQYTYGTTFDSGDYFIAAKIADIDDTIIQPGDVEIADSIKTDGCLRPQINSAALSGQMTFAWYRSGDGGSTWEQVQRLRVTGTSYNIAADGSWINVALDGGADKLYKLEIVQIDGAQLSSPIAANPYQVPYYSSIQNGDFEEPVISTGAVDPEHFQPFLPNGTSGMIWKTTADDGEVEFISVASPEFQALSWEWHNCEAAASGNQYVELNANMAGSLYQDVLTVPGSTMHWSLRHRGRGPRSTQNDASQRDTLYVVIMSTTLAEQYAVTSQSAVMQVINNPAQYPGAQVWEYTDDNIQWYEHHDNYTVPVDQYLTRYFFVAGPTAYDASGQTSDQAQPYTVGNHLDHVFFSTQLPPPDKGEANLQVEKTVRGLSAEDAKRLMEQLEFTVDGQTVSGTSMTDFSADGNGGFSASYQMRINLGYDESAVITVTETADSAVYTGYNLAETTVSVDGAAAIAGNQTSITVLEEQTGTVAFTNTYERTRGTVVLKKSDPAGNPLPGAEFELAALSDGSWITLSGRISIDSSGQVQLDNLDCGVLFRLTELLAPNGFQKLTSPVYFQMAAENGQLVLKPCDSGGAFLPAWPEGLLAAAGTSSAQLQVTNQTGYILPHTGGRGPAPYLYGGLLMLAGALLCVYIYLPGYAKRRRESS